MASVNTRGVLAGNPASRISQERYGGQIRPVSRVVTVTTAATRLLNNDPRRIGWSITNRSVNDGAWDYNASGLTQANGNPVAANAGNATSHVEEDGDSTTYEVFGINSTASGDWRVVEWLLSTVGQE
jgi:hypothetical protein